MPNSGDMFKIRPLRVEKSQPNGPTRGAQMPGGKGNQNSKVKRPPKSSGGRKSKKHY